MGRNGKWLFLFFLVILFLLCPAASRGSTILYDGRYGDGYGRILQKYGGNQWDILPETGALTERFTESDITAIEAYDFQAQVIRRNHWNRYEWYPQYVTSMVLAVRDDCPVTISGWQSVKEGQVTLGFPMDTPRQQMGIMAISYGLTGALKKEAAIQYLKQLKKEGRLRLDRRYNEVWYLHSQEKDGAQVYVMTDVEARLLQQQGEAIHIVMPREGTLAFQKGLLAKSHLPLPFSLINRELSLSGYDRVSQGTAVGVQDLQSLAREMGSISGLIRREVVGNPSFEQRFRIPHVVYYSGFLFLVILWGGSLQRRVVKPHLKQLTLCLVAVSVLWIMQRLSKMVIPGSLDIWVRYGWYSYYVFFGILVTLAAFLGYEADAGLEDRKWPCFLYGVGAFNMGLALMVLTNDFHHWVFTFPAGLSAADSIHEYGRGYILLQSSYAIQFILVNGWLYYRIWKQQLWGMKQLIPLFISGLYVFYVVSYVCGIPWASYTELVIVTIAWAFLWLESLLDTGIIPSNRGYGDFFRYSHLAMEIRGKEGQVLFQSHQVPKESSEDIEKRVCPISGGQVVWYQSVKDLNEKKRKLQLVVDALERSYKLGRMEEEIRRSYIRLLTEKKAVRELETVLESKGSLIMHYIEFLETAKPGNEADAAVSRLNVLASYIKKRCVMMLKGKEEQQLWVRELKSSIEELFKYLQKTGLKCLLEFNLAGAMETGEALALYDFIEQTAEAATAGGETHMICSIREKDDAYWGRILLDHHIWVLPFMRQLREDSRLQIPGVRLQLRDLDYAYSVEIEVRHREDN